MSGSSLDQLKAHTKIVADTGEIAMIEQYKPLDATTNPSLILKAASKPEYGKLMDAAVAYGKAHGSTTEERLEATIDKLFVLFGCEIVKIVDGVVSTEVDARLSFDTGATVAKARKLIAMYEEEGVSRDRILIKIATTWEGCRAAETLEKEGIHCNMTLLFSLYQAVAAAEAGATLISPFVGRITDWHKAKTGTEEYAPEDDPGVASVRAIFRYYARAGYKTIVMGASFRNTGQVKQLCGVHKLTISPTLLEELSKDNSPVPKLLDFATEAKADDAFERIDGNKEAVFRWGVNEDAMATEKLAEGIRKFAEDTQKLEDIIRDKFNNE